MPEDVVVRHDSPVLGVDKVVRVELDRSWHPIRYEDLATVILDDGRTVVSCVPIFLRDLHLGDVIEATETADGCSSVRRVDRGQSWVFRIRPRDHHAFTLAHELIHQFDGPTETWGPITAVAIRGNGAADAFARRLQQLENDGQIEYDTVEQ